MDTEKVNILCEDTFKRHSCSLKARNSEKIITSYKPILLLLDFGILLFSFGLSTLVLQIHLADHNFYCLATIFLVLAAIFISYFWVFDLYSYNANFIWKNILKILEKHLLSV